ncbi:MAG: polysaccharide deacetylase family protein [Bacteroidales bacterium]|nr:polysaccharide deacetylase family protein [Bacteroidales bacterium]
MKMNVENIMVKIKALTKRLGERTISIFKNSISKITKLKISLKFLKPLLSYRNILDIIILAAIGLCVYYILHLQHVINCTINDLKTTDTIIIERVCVHEQLAKHDSIKIDTSYQHGVVVENRFTISGLAEPNRIISLTVNGSVVAAVVTQGTRFAFNDVLAKPGLNHFVVKSLDDEGRSIILEEINFMYGKPPVQYLVHDFTRGDIARKQIALTFDGGWFDNVAGEILDILKEYNIKCTMFVTGNFMKLHPETVKRMVAEGHEVCNHSWSHPHLTTYEENGRHETVKGMNGRKLRRELEKAEKYFEKLTGTEMTKLWRSPYGEQNEEIRRWAAEEGYRHIGWTVGSSREDGMDTMDWVADTTSDAYYTADEIAGRLLSYGKNSEYGANGTVILMHLGSLRTKDYPHSKLPYIIQEFQKRGYKFVKVSEMLQ